MLDLPAFITKVLLESQTNAQYMLVQACMFLKLESRYAGTGIVDENGVLEDLRAVAQANGFPVTGANINTLPVDTISNATTQNTNPGT